MLIIEQERLQKNDNIKIKYHPKKNSPLNNPSKNQRKKLIQNE